MEAVTTLVYSVILFGNVVSGPTTMVMNNAEACAMASKTILSSQNTKTIESYGGKVIAECSTK